MKIGCLRRGHAFHTELFLKASGCFFKADPCGHLMRCQWDPFAFISRHHLSPHGTAHCPSWLWSPWPHTCPGEHILPKFLLPTGQLPESPLTPYQLPLATLSNISCITFTLPTVQSCSLHMHLLSVVFPALLVPVVAHPCSGTGFSHPHPQKHKQVPAVFTKAK